ncbi:uncharacterized protein LOC126787220 [Argentina anserina]|uniref:uncharacterized protein LOC126787220 n=1 Tax=Argentina anserina TaxID=57926 RepID=UPI0021769353|nr:uncharacterized protein LOC126787220 [Potentilla anserina]
MSTLNPTPPPNSGGRSCRGHNGPQPQPPLPSANDPIILTLTPGTVASTTATPNPVSAARMANMAKDLAKCQQHEALEREKAAALQVELDRMRAQLERVERSYQHGESQREGSAQTKGREQVNLSISLTPSELAKKWPPSPWRIRNREEWSTSLTSNSRPHTTSHSTDPTLALILQWLTQ